MRAVIMLAAVLPLLSACGVSLHTHARIAAASAELLDAAGAEIEREAHEDEDLIRASGVDVESRMALLEKSFAPIETAYSVAKNAHARYTAAIWRALGRGEKELSPGALGALLGAWRALAAAGEAVGVSLPEPPADLTSALGEPP